MAKYRRKPKPAPTLQRLWLVKTRGVTKDGMTVVKSKLVVLAATEDEACQQVRWSKDRRLYKEHRIIGVYLQGGAVFNLSTKSFPVREQQREERPQSDNTPAEQQRTNQPASMMSFAVGIVGLVTGKTPEHCMTKLGAYLLKRGRGENTRNPIAVGGQVRVEELGEVGGANVSTAMERLQEAANPHFVRGGAVSPR